MKDIYQTRHTHVTHPRLSWDQGYIMEKINGITYVIIESKICVVFLYTRYLNFYLKSFEGD